MKENFFVNNNSNKSTENLRNTERNGLNDKMAMTTPCIGLLHLNISGALNKQDELCVAVNTLEKQEKISIDVICLCETNIEAGTESNLKLKNFYTTSWFSRKKSKRGGVAILVKKNIESKLLENLGHISRKFSFECCGVELMAYGIIVICIYTNKTPTSTDSLFFHSLSDLLYDLRKKKRKKKIYVETGT